MQMQISPQVLVSRMIENLVKKQSLLSGLLELTRKQTGALTEDALERLEQIITDKQVLIDRINILDEEFNGLFLQLKSELKVESLDQVEDTSGIAGLKELKNSVKAVKDLINEIYNLEQNNSKKAKELLENLGNEIRKVNQGKKIASAYKQANSITPPYFIDRKE